MNKIDDSIESSSFTKINTPTSHDNSGGGVIPRRNCDYESRDYWEDRFAQETQYEWLLSFHHLRRQLEPLLQGVVAKNEPSSSESSFGSSCSTASPQILVVGCGNSPFSADLYDSGFVNIVNIDYSETVIASMKVRHVESRPLMQWRVMDMTNMSELDNESFDLVFDKAAMDTLLTNEGDVWDPNPSSIAAARSMCHHISRVLKPGGTFVQVSLIQPHFRNKYLLGQHYPPTKDGTNHPCDKTSLTSSEHYSDEFSWTLRVEDAGVPEDSDSTSSAFGYFLYKMKKNTTE